MDTMVKLNKRLRVHNGMYSCLRIALDAGLMEADGGVVHILFTQNARIHLFLKRLINRLDLLSIYCAYIAVLLLIDQL